MTGVVEIEKSLFNLLWKYNSEGENLDLDIAPSTQATLAASKAVKAHTLSKISQLIVESTENSTVTLHDDGSRAQVCGGYSVSGVTVPGLNPGDPTRYFPIPTTKCKTITRESGRAKTNYSQDIGNL